MVLERNEDAVGRGGVMIQSVLIGIAVVALAAINGLTAAKMAGVELWHGAVGGAIAAVVALFIAKLFRKRTVSFELKIAPQALLGLRIATCGFITAACGMPITVFFSNSLGAAIVLLGIIAGFVGVGIHRYTFATEAQPLEKNERQ